VYKDTDFSTVRTPREVRWDVAAGEVGADLAAHAHSAYSYYKQKVSQQSPVVQCVVFFD
jgi:hypothetical protein